MNKPGEKFKKEKSSHLKSESFSEEDSSSEFSDEISKHSSALPKLKQIKHGHLRKSKLADELDKEKN